MKIFQVSSTSIFWPWPPYPLNIYVYNFDQLKFDLNFPNPRFKRGTPFHKSTFFLRLF